jgi:hypothetical protein
MKSPLTTHIAQDGILHACCSNGLLLGPEGWRQWIAFAQPVKQICAFHVVMQRVAERGGQANA